MKTLFEQDGFHVHICRFDQLDWETDFSGSYVLYQSSERQGPFYKTYIEDVAARLQCKGAILLPCLDYLRAHHNKCYMELLRRDFASPELKTLETICFGSPQDALRNMPHRFPVVLKQTAGSGSEGVYLAQTPAEYQKYLSRIGNVFLSSPARAFWDAAKQTLRQLRFWLSAAYRRNEHVFPQPVVVQEFIPNLAGDYKVVYMGGKYFTLYRKNRENDFRASGSGRLFTVPESERHGLLDFASKVTTEINFPVIGMDIAFDGTRYHLIEFQMLHIGPYTLQAAGFWHEYHAGNWVEHTGKCNLEIEFCRAITAFIRAPAE